MLGVRVTVTVVADRSHGSGNIVTVTPSGSLQDTFLYLLVSNSAPIVRAQDKGGRIFGPPTLPWLFWRGGACQWSGGPGVGARCGNGLFPTYKSPKFYLSFTILVSFILVKYPDRIGLVNTVPWYRRYRTVGRYIRPTV